VNVICIDTAGGSVVIAAVTSADGRLIAGAAREVRAQGVLDVLDEVLADAAWSRADIGTIVVGTGPGGFTGVRIGVTIARGLAEALDVPLHPVSSLLALVASDTDVPPTADNVWATLDARRGEHFVQGYTQGADGAAWHPTTDAHALRNDELADLDGHIVSRTAPTPAGLAAAAVQALTFDQRGAGGDPLLVTPEYVRAPDAEPPRPRLRIDDMRGSDLAAVLTIEARSFPTPWSEAMYLEELARCRVGQGVSLVARDLTGGARVVGAVLAAWMGDSWHVMNVLVDPPARRRGIARQLLDELLERTGTHDLGIGDGWTLEVREGNAAAIALYESRGFVNQGLRPGYYSDTGESAVIMWRGAGVPA
jgi:tRNA threonylcarbamoyl adenosine modification protein YeaZ